MANGTRPARLEVEERRRQLIQIGRELFAHRSFDDISIDEIAQAAGISKGLLYHYFPSKRDFYVELIRTAGEELLSATAGEAAGSDDPVRAGLDAWLDYIEEHERGYVMLMQGGIGSDPEVRAIVDDTRERFIQRILGGDAEKSSPALRLAVRGWIGFVEGATLDWARDRRLGRERLRTLLLGSFRAALAQAHELDPELASELAELQGAPG
jgi:AcrR family transcriptional regulator